MHVRDIDIVDQTPLLDIKPYIPEFDSQTGVKLGWLEAKVIKAMEAKADGRFSK